MSKLLVVLPCGEKEVMVLELIQKLVVKILVWVAVLQPGLRATLMQELSSWMTDLKTQDTLRQISRRSVG